MISVVYLAVVLKETREARGNVSSGTLDVRRFPDGQWDVDAIVASGGKDLRLLILEWVRARLGGSWMYVGLDDSNEEDLEDVFVELWKVSCPESPLRDALGWAFAELLKEACIAENKSTKSLLWLIACTAPPACWPVIREHLPTVFARSKEPNDYRWLLAGSVYPAATALSHLWRPALSCEERRVHSFHALAHDLVMGVEALPVYLCNASERDVRLLLDGALRQLRRLHGDEQFLAAMKEHRHDYDNYPQLRQAIDAELSAKGLKPVFEPEGA